MTPVELLDDHARRPRGIGKLLNASAIGDVGSIVAGDALRFYLKLEGAGDAERVVAAKFQVFNCQDQIGAASVVAEAVVGMTLEQARELSPADVCARLGGLDPWELPARLWSLVGLRAAIASWRRDDLPADRDLELPLHCRCLGIPEETVRQAIAVRSLTTVDAVVEATGAGSSCGTCRIDIPALLDAATAKPAVAAAPATGPASRIQLLLRIRRAADEHLREARAQGGDLELWDFAGSRVLVRGKGALAHDAAARAAAMAALQAALRSTVDPALEVAES